MDSFEWNKIAGAVLFALLVSFGLSIVSEIVFETETPEAPGYVIALAESPEAHGEGGDAPAEEPIAALLVSADPAAAASSIKRCATCHTFGEGEANKVGPNLYGIVMRAIAGHEGYEYSAPMQAFAAEAKVWDYDHLSDFLASPGQVVPKTKMAFPGLKNGKERANVIAYLRTLAASPEPLPPPPTDTASTEPMAPAGEAAAEAPAEEQAAAVEQPAAGEAAAEAPVEGQASAAAEQPAAETPAADAPADQQAAADAPADQQAAADQPAAETPAADAPAEQQVAQAEAPAGGEVAAGGETSAVAAAVAAADATKGQTAAKRCIACHTFEQGAANKVGPNLWEVVNRPIATVAEFNYSDAMKEFSEGGAKTWTLDHLSAYLADPKGAIPGNKMAFPGLKNETQRADLLAYLHTLSANPAPLQ